MSHKVESKVEIFDLDALKAALKELGATFTENGTWLGWYGREGTPVDVLVPKSVFRGNYDLGFRQVDGKLSVVSESMSYGDTDDFIRKFKRAYTLHAATNLLKSYGYCVTKHTDGTYRARATMATAGKLLQRKAKAAKQDVLQVRY